MTIKLSDLHYVLLAIAAKRSSGSILPPSTSIGLTRSGLTRAIKMLIKNGLAEEIESNDDENIWRTDGERKLAAVITDAGRAAVTEADGRDPNGPVGGTAPSLTSSVEQINPPTKRSLVIEMLCRADGATLTQLVETTGWLPHTTRAALTGLRKKGHVITAAKVDGVSVYRMHRQTA
jgi:hypothetical protein